jgi:hypothetical protein
VQFADSFLGPNVLGVNTFMDIQRTFKVTAGKTQNLNTHMQVDSIYVDFGFITNAGQIFYLVTLPKNFYFALRIFKSAEGSI